MDIYRAVGTSSALCRSPFVSDSTVNRTVLISILRSSPDSVGPYMSRQTPYSIAAGALTNAVT